MAQENFWFGQGNTTLDKSIEDALGDTVRAYNMTAAPAFTSANVNSGSFGNSGLAQAQSEAQRQLQTSLGRQANDMRTGNYQFNANLGQRGSEFDRTLATQKDQFGRTLGQRQTEFDQTFGRDTYNDAFAQRQQNLQNAFSLLGMQNQYGQQALGYGSDIQNTPLNYYGQFTNWANGIGNNFATTSGTTSAKGSPIMGALGGAQLGGALAGNWGSYGGGSAGYGPSMSPNAYALPSSFDQYLAK